MKHRFLLDENILYFAICGTDEQGNHDPTSTNLVRLIGANCHSIVVNNFLVDRYHRHIDLISRERARSKAMEPVAFIKQLVVNSQKRTYKHEECPEIPQGIAVPRKDIEIVRLALLAEAKIITGDGPLRAAVNNNPALGLEALNPAEAIALASDS